MISSKHLVRLDMADFGDVLQQITARIQHLPEDCNLAVARAINRTLQAIYSEAVRIGTEKYTIRDKNFSKSLMGRSSYLGRKATPSNLVGSVDFRGSTGRPLVHFKPSPGKAPNWRGVPVAKRRPKAGVSSLIKKGGTRKVYAKDGAKPFIATMKSGHKGLFVRQPSGKLEQLFGPSAIQLLGGNEARTRLQAKAEQTFPKRLAHEVDALLAGVSRGKGR